MKKGIQKFVKGLFGIFMIKLTIFSIVLVYQACQTDENIDHINFEKDFINTINTSVQGFSRINVINQKDIDQNPNMIQKMSNIEMVEVDLIQTNPDEQVSIQDFEDLTDLISQGIIELPFDDQDCNASGNCLSVVVDESAIKESLNPATSAAKNYLYTNGFNDNDIAEILDGKSEATLVPLVQLLINFEDQDNSTVLNVEDSLNLLFGIQSANAQNWAKIGNCAKKAFGFDDLKEFKNWKNLSKKAQNKLLRKVATKMAARYASTWLGVALIVGEFALCMR